MSRLTPCLLLLLLLSSLACSQQSALEPPAAALPQAAATLGATESSGDLVESAVALFRVEIDPATLTATSQLIETRHGQQSELYSLDIARFMTNETFQVRSIHNNGFYYELEYTTTHPFPAPQNLAGPASGANRADLAATGKVLWLEDSQRVPWTYFAGSDNVKLGWDHVGEIGIDGFLNPSGLINLPAFTTNTFPYQQLVNERLDNRLGLSNGGNPQGNYGPLGWQTAAFTDGITGYGIWGQGQTSTHTLTLFFRDTTPLVLNVALLVKYEDPRGGSSSQEKRANRLPKNDPQQFGYRMPHAALDVGWIERGTLSYTFVEGLPGSGTLDCYVEDWDARASESTQPLLRDEPDPTLVYAGESGIPQFTVDIPYIDGINAIPLTLTDDDSSRGGDPEPDSGRPGDELWFTASLDGTASSRPEEAFGLLRAVDITDVIPPLGWENQRFELDPLSPLPTHQERPTYQIVLGRIIERNLPSGSWDFLNGVQTVQDTGTIEAVLAVDTVATGNMTGDYTAEVDWGDGSPIDSTDHNLSEGAVHFTHLYAYSGTPPTPQIAPVRIHLIDGTFPASEQDAVPPANPDVTIFPPDTSTGWARSFGGASIDFGFNVAMGPDGSIYAVGSYDSPDVDFGNGPEPLVGTSDVFLVKFDPAGTQLWYRVWHPEGNDNGRAVSVGTDGAVLIGGEFEGSVDFGGGMRTALGNHDGFVIKLDSDGNYQWDAEAGSIGSDLVMQTLIDAAGNCLYTGTGGPMIDFGGGPSPLNSPVFAVRCTADGTFDWAYAVDGAGGFATGIAARSTGYAIDGFFSNSAPNPADFGGGDRVTVGSTDFFAVALDDAGQYIWDYTAGGPSTEYAWDVAVQSTDAVWATGTFTDSATFGTTPVTGQGQDIFLLALDASGIQQQVWAFGSSGRDDGYGIEADAADRIFISGGASGPLDLGGGTISGGPYAAMFNPSGVWQWDYNLASAGYFYAASIGNGGTPLVAGLFQGTIDFEPGPGITNLTSNGGYDACFVRLRSDGTW